MVDRFLRRVGIKTIPDEAPPSLESFYAHLAAVIMVEQRILRKKGQ